MGTVICIESPVFSYSPFTFQTGSERPTKKKRLPLPVSKRRGNSMPFGVIGIINIPPKYTILIRRWAGQEESLEKGTY